MVLISLFSRRFTVAVFFRQFNAIGPLFVHYALLPYVLIHMYHTLPYVRIQRF